MYNVILIEENMQRTAAIRGKFPILVVAPFGHDDPHTTTIVEHIQKELKCFAVINYMWERAPKYNYYKSQADCHNVQHCFEDVVRQEYLNWILKFKDTISNMHHTANIFYIRGCNNAVRKQANADLDIIVGYGDSKQPSHTCQLHSKNALIHLLNNQAFTTYMGAPDSPYSAREPDNMTQIFRNIFYDERVESFELHIVRALRTDETEANLTANSIANAFEDFIEEQEKDSEGDVISYSFPLNRI